MSPTISRVSFVFVVLSLIASSASAQAWKQRVEQAAAVSQAAAAAATPEQAHRLASAGAGKLSGEKGERIEEGVRLPPPVRGPKVNAIHYSREDIEEGRHLRKEEVKESRPMSGKMKGLIFGALIGAVLGSLIGLAFGGGGVAAGAIVGALAGGVTGFVLGSAADAVAELWNHF